MKIRKIFLILFLVVSVFMGTFFTPGCKKGDKEELIVPVFAPLTGPIAVYGQWLKNSIEIAAEEINAKDSAIKIRFDFFDTQGNPKDTMSAYQKSALSDRPIIIVAITGSAFALAPLTEKANQILLATVVTHPEVTKKGQNIYRYFINKGKGAESLADYSISAGINEVSLLYINEDGGLAEKTAFSNAFTSKAGNIRNEYTFERTMTDFKDVINKMKGNDEKNVVISGYGKAYGLLLKQVKELEADFRIITSCDVVDPYIVSMAGEPSPGTIFYNPMYNKENPKYLNLAQKYKERFGTEPPFYAGFGYDIPFVIKKAIDLGEGKIDSVSIKKGLSKISDFYGAYGKVSLGADRDSDIDYSIIIIGEKGEQKVMKSN